MQTALPQGDGTVTGHDGVALHYRVSGRGPVLLAHPGGPGTAADWLGGLAGLDEVATIIWLDPRGTGGSTAPHDARSYTLAHYAADVEALRDQLGLEQMGLLGFSHGGMVGMRYAVDHPDRLTHLVLLDTAPVMDQPALERMGQAMARRQDEPWYEAARAVIEADPDPSLSDAEAARQMMPMMPMYFHEWGRPATDFTGTLATTTFHRRTAESWGEEQGTFDLRPELARIRTPTLVIVGDDDFICDVVSARIMASGIPGARLAVIPEAGHFCWVERPELFRRAIDPFLAGAAPPPNA